MRVLASEGRGRSLFLFFRLNLKRTGVDFALFFELRREAQFKGWLKRAFQIPQVEKQTVKIYIGNLSWKANDEDLRAAFEAYGAVESAEVVKERETGRSRGFGFVVMPDAAEAQKAIAALNGQEIVGRPIRCNEAQERSERRPFRG